MQKGEHRANGLARDTEEVPSMQAKATPGIRRRHSRFCPANVTRDDSLCTTGRKGGCEPYFEAFVFDPRAVVHKKACASRARGVCDCDPTKGAKVRKTFPTLAAAKTWRRDAAPQAAKGAFGATSKATLREAADVWLEGAKRNEILTRSGRPYKPSALRGYEADLRLHVLDDLGAVRLVDLRRRDLQTLVDRLVGRGCSGSKVRNVLMPVRAICRHALERDELLTNPTSNLRLPAVGGRRERIASPTEAAELLTGLFENDQALWATAFYGGLRLGELRALAVEHVDLKANRIRVSRALDALGGFIEPKSAKGTRDVPIPGVLRKYLAAEIARTGRRGTDLVFGRAPAAPFTPTHVRERATKAWEAENAERRERQMPELEPIGLHECRHTYVSLMHAAGVSLEEIGDYVGHSSTYMTDRYRHLLPGSGSEAAAKLDKFLGAATA